MWVRRKCCPGDKLNYLESCDSVACVKRGRCGRAKSGWMEGECLPSPSSFMPATQATDSVLLMTKVNQHSKGFIPLSIFATITSMNSLCRLFLRILQLYHFISLSYFANGRKNLCIYLNLSVNWFYFGFLSDIRIGNSDCPEVAGNLIAMQL